jgi:hypothetical protein
MWYCAVLYELCKAAWYPAASSLRTQEYLITYNLQNWNSELLYNATWYVPDGPQSHAIIKYFDLIYIFIIDYIKNISFELSSYGT